ncbi:MAG: hypothetical protein F6K24_45425 [Okeania sp. SIO2D1]|nr:hypothetical protein [Okeania sp. SIO2D1]
MSLTLLIIIVVIAVVVLSKFSQSIPFLRKFNRRWQQLQGSSQSHALRRELLNRVDSGTAQRLINQAKLNTPGKSECWYLEKVLYDLKRGR